MQHNKIYFVEAAKSLTERKTEEQTPSEPPSVKKRGRKKSTLQKAPVKSEGNFFCMYDSLPNKSKTKSTIKINKNLI